MKDLTIELEDRPGALAAMGEALGRAGVSVEGGGAWVVNGCGVAHFLFKDGEAALRALEEAGIAVLAARDVIVQRLKQDEPGQLGKLTRRMAAAGANIEVMYSDHDNRLVLVVDDVGAGQRVAEAWDGERRVSKTMNVKHHRYDVGGDWTGNDGEGTRGYREYRRDHTITCAGKAPIAGSSDPAFSGDASRINPEELMVASLSACHMLWYLHLCSVNQVIVTGYSDAARGFLQEDANGSGSFSKVVLIPVVQVSEGSDHVKARALHDEAHRLCFMARSVNFPVDVEPTIESS